MVMSLIESLTRIKNAVYGREVREAIHDGVFRANQIANEALEAQAYDGNSLADVTLAKDGLPTLDARIRRDVNNLENKKADKAEVTAQLAQKVGGGKLAEMGDLSQAVKTAMTGGSVAVVGEGAVGMVNLNAELSMIISNWEALMTNENESWVV